MLPLQEPENQEPRPGLPSQAGFGPVSFTGPQAVAYQQSSLDQRRNQKRRQVWARATLDFSNNTLPAIMPRDVEQEVFLEGLFLKRDGGAPWEEFQADVQQFAPDVQERMAEAFGAHTKMVESSQVNPLGVGWSGEEGLERLYAIANHRQGMAVMEHYADTYGTKEAKNMVDTIQQLQARMNVAASVFVAPSAHSALGAPEARAGRLAGAKAMSSMADRIEAKHRLEAQGRAASQAWDMGLPVGMPVGQTTPGPAQDERFQRITFLFSQALEEQAEELGISYSAMEDMPVTVAEGRAVLDNAMGALMAVQGEEVEDIAIALGVMGEAAADRALVQLADAFHAYMENLPEGDEKASAREALYVLSDIATGKITQKSEISGGVPLIGALFHYILAPPSVMMGEATTGALPKIRPTELVFDDGYVAYDALTAAEHTLKLMDEGGVMAPNPEAWEVSERHSRGSALMENVRSASARSAARSDVPGASLTDLGSSTENLSAMGALSIWGFSQGTKMATGYGEAQGGVTYALPVPIFERVTEWATWAERAEGFLDHFGGEGGQFVMDELVDSAMSGSQAHWGSKAPAYIMALIYDLVVDPWNVGHTGPVRAGVAALAERAVVAKAASRAADRAAEFIGPIQQQTRTVTAQVDELLGLVTKPKTRREKKLARKLRFKDGAEMSAEWVGVADAIAKVFRRGEGIDLGGGEEIAELVLTKLRDTPAQSMESFRRILLDDPKFLDQFADNLERSGVMDTWRRFEKPGVSPSEARRRWAQEIWEESDQLVGDLVEGAAEKFGREGFWASPQHRMMENSRGIYFGPVGIPLTPVARRMEKFHNSWRDYMAGEATGAVEKALKSTLGKGLLFMDKAFEMASSAALGVFSQSHWATGEVSMAGLVRRHRKVPYRLRAMYAERYRRILASGSQRVQATTIEMTSRGFDENQKWLGLLPEDERKLLTLFVASGDNAAEAAAKIWDNEALLKDYGFDLGWSDKADGQLKLQRRLEGLEEQANKIRQLHDMIYDTERGLGVQVNQKVDHYVMHYFHTPDMAKLRRDLEVQAARDAKGASEVTQPGRAMRSDSGKRRIGPIDIYEGMQKGYNPELDMGMLLLNRLSQHLEVTTRAQFARSVAAEFGTPAVRGREALMRVMQGGQVNRWAAEKGAWDVLDDLDDYNKQYAKARRGLRSSRMRELSRNFKRMSQDLGIRLKDFSSGFFAASAKSVKFLRMASSRKKSMLDKLMPPSLRDEYRLVAREMLGLRNVIDDNAAYLAKHGYEPQGMDAVVRDDYGQASKLSHEKADMGMSIEAEKKRLAGANRKQAYVQQELREVMEEVEGAQTRIAELEEARGTISSQWDEAKKQLGDLGYRVDDLAQARSLEGVRRNPELVPAQTSPAVKSAEGWFQKYKQQQALYKENHLALREAGEDLAFYRKQQGTSERRLAIADGEVQAANERMKAAGREKGARKAEMRRHGKKLLAAQERAERAAQKLREASEALKEAEARLAFLADSPVARQIQHHLDRSLRRLVRGKQAARRRVAHMSIARGISFSEARRRVLAPKLPAGSKESRLAQARRREAVKAQREGRFYKDRDMSLRQRPPATMVPEHELSRYIDVEEMFQAFGWTSDDVARILWDNFGATHLHEIPIGELEALVSPTGGIYAKMGRYLIDPADGLEAVLRVADHDAADRVAVALGLNPKKMTADTKAAKIEDALDDMYEGIERGDAKAIELARTISPLDISKALVAEDISQVYARFPGVGGGVEGKAARIAREAGATPLQKELANTFIPMEVGMIYRQMIGEGLITKEAMEESTKAAKILDSAAWGAANTVDVFNRAFKTGALYGKPSWATIRRNGLIDGFKAMLHMGTMFIYHPAVRREFLEDITSKSGSMMTASGPVSRSSLHAMFDTQAAAIMAARMDDASAMALNLGERQQAGARKRFQRSMGVQGKGMNRKKGVGVSKGGAIGAAAGVLPGAVIGDVAAGAEMGFTLGVVGEAAWMGTPHSARKMPTTMEHFLGTTPAAGEAVENFYRGAILWSNMKAGMGPREAAERTNILMRDYSNVKPIDRMIAALPVMFWNFFKQNAIAMGARFANSPARLTFIPRLVQHISDSAPEEYKDEWQNAANTFFGGGKAYYISDEMEAAIGLADPLWQLIVNRSVPGFAESLGRNVSPIVKDIVMDWEDDPLPPGLAKRIYAKHGAVSVPGLDIWQDKSGLVQSSMNRWWRLALIASGSHVSLREIGRQRDRLDQGSLGYLFAETFGLFRVYDGESRLDAQSELLEQTLQEFMKESDAIRFDQDTNAPYIYMPDSSPLAREMMQAILDHAQGEYVAEQWRFLKREIRLRTSGNMDMRQAGSAVITDQ